MPKLLAFCSPASPLDTPSHPLSGLVEYIISGPVVAIALEGKDVVAQVGSDRLWLVAAAKACALLKCGQCHGPMHTTAP